MRNQRIEKLDGLRGIFSLMIVPFHYKLLYLPEVIYNNFIIRQSFIFVDFFFVLSGFVIVYNYNSIRHLDQFFIFLKKRIARLFPLLLVTSSIFLLYRFIRNVGVTYFSDAYDFTNKSVLNIDNLLLEYFDSLFFTNSTTILGSGLGINPPSWSISAEMIVYILFGLLSLIAIGKKKSILILLITVSAVIFLMSYGTLFTSGDYGFIRALISFNLGYFVWVFSRYNYKLNNNFELLLLALLISIMYLLQYVFGHNGLFAIISIPLFFGITILVMLKTSGILSKILNSNILQFLGKVSYSNYLNHYLFISLIPQFIFGIIKLRQNNVSQIIVFIFSILFILLYSKYTYKYVEISGGKFLKKILLKS